MINFERNDWNQQKTQFSLGLKFSHNAWTKHMKHENKWKRKGKKVLRALQDKNPRRNLRENDKNLLWILDRSKRERKAFEKFEKVLNTWKANGFKKLSVRFSIDRKIDLIEWKLHSIDLTMIKHQSNQADSNQFF